MAPAPEPPPLPVWPMTLDAVLALPSFDVTERANLPDDHGLYFALVDRKYIAYIGATWSFQERWHRHEKLDQLRDLGAVSVAFLLCPYRPLLWQAERAAIWQLKPTLNGQIRQSAWRRHQRQLWPTPEWVARNPGWIDPRTALHPDWIDPRAALLDRMGGRE